MTGFITTAVAMVSLVTAMERLGDRQPQIWPTLALAALGFGCLAYAIRHFRRATAPMVRLTALQVPTFRVTMYGGSLFRASISAVPFLLPLLFQADKRPLPATEHKKPEAGEGKQVLLTADHPIRTQATPEGSADSSTDTV